MSSLFLHERAQLVNSQHGSLLVLPALSVLEGKKNPVVEAGELEDIVLRLADLRDILVREVGENRGKGPGQCPAAHQVVRAPSAEGAHLLLSFFGVLAAGASGLDKRKLEPLGDCPADFVLAQPIGGGPDLSPRADDSFLPARGSGNTNRRQERLKLDAVVSQKLGRLLLFLERGQRSERWRLMPETNRDRASLWAAIFLIFGPCHHLRESGFR